MGIRGAYAAIGRRDAIEMAEIEEERMEREADRLSALRAESRRQAEVEAGEGGGDAVVGAPVYADVQVAVPPRALPPPPLPPVPYTIDPDLL